MRAVPAAWKVSFYSIVSQPSESFRFRTLKRQGHLKPALRRELTVASNNGEPQMLISTWKLADIHRNDQGAGACGHRPSRSAIVATRRQLLIGALSVAAATSLAVPAGAAVLTVTNLDQYRGGLARLAPRYRTALVDIGAEWCAFCKTIDQKILPDPGVRRAMERIALIKVDVTRMGQSSRELLRYLRADGPPTLFVVQTASGHEFSGTRSVGAFRASDLVRRLRPFA